MRVVVTTIVSLNPGDAAILEGSLALLREAFGDDLSVTVMDKDGPSAAARYPWATFDTALFSRTRWGRLRRWLDRKGYGHRVYWLDGLRLGWAGRMLRGVMAPLARVLVTADEMRVLRTYLGADLVIASGGTYLVEHYNLLPPLLEYELVLGLGRRLAFFPQSLGPFQATSYRPRLKAVFLSAASVFLRDERSAAHLDELGVPSGGVRVVGDAAFSLAGAGAGQSAEDESSPGRDMRIAVSVRDWNDFGDQDAAQGRARYLDSIASGVVALVRERQAKVAFLSTCQGIPEYWTDDARTADEVVALLPPDVAAAVTVDRSFRQPREILTAYAGFDGVVATRMHAAILAMCAGVPTLGIAYEFKTAELFEALGLEKWAVDIRGLDPGGFAELTLRFFDSLGSLQTAVSRGVLAQKARLTNLVADLENLRT